MSLLHCKYHHHASFAASVNSYHEAFLRSRPDLIHLVKRLKNEGKRIPDIASEPDFYQMPFLPDIAQPYQQFQVRDPFVDAAAAAPAAVYSSASMNNASQCPVALSLNNYQVMAMNSQPPPVRMSNDAVNVMAAQPLLQGTNLGFQVAGANTSHTQITSNFAAAITQDGSNQMLEWDQFCNLDQKPAAQPTAHLKLTSTGGSRSFLKDHTIT